MENNWGEGKSIDEGESCGESLGTVAADELGVVPWLAGLELASRL